MTVALPPAIAGFFDAHNSGQTGTFGELFTSDAIVRDESHEYRAAAINTWMDEAIAKYRPQADVTQLTRDDNQLIVTAQVSGTFPGSPTRLCYQFTLQNDKIAGLTIGT